MAIYPDEILSRIRDSVDIVELVSQHVLLKKAGANYKGLCPFHEEKTPSFNVHPGKRIFYCFGCSRGGDVFKFVMLHQNLTFPEAIRLLAGKAGVPLPAAAPETPVDEGEEREKREIRRINDLAAGFYRDALSSKAGAGARRYLAERGISGGSIETFGIGLAPAGWQSLLEYLSGRGVSPRKTVAAGLAKPRSGRDGFYDVFRGRIVFPIRTPGGGIAGFGGRTFGGEEEDSGPKYLNSPDTPVFRKNRILYGLHESREEIRSGRTALLVEGYFDVIALHQHGFRNAVASMGTALTSEHVRTLRREGFCETLVFCFDPDAAGEGAARRGGAMLLENYQQAGLPQRWRGGKELTTLLKADGPGGSGGSNWNRMALRVVVLPSGEDADSFVRSRGAEAFRDLLGKAENLIDYLLDRVVSACPADSPIERRLEVLQEAVSILTGQREAVRREYVRELSERLRIDEDLAGRALRARGRRDAGVQATVEVKARSERLPPAEKMLVQILLSHPEMAGRIEVPVEQFSNARLRRIGAAALASGGEAGTGGSGEGEFVPAVLAAVGDPDAEKLAAALAMAPPVWGDEPERAAGDCIARILSDGLKRRKEDWRSRIADAKRRGDEKEVQALMEEREAMRKEQVSPLQKMTQAGGGVPASSAG